MLNKLKDWLFSENASFALAITGFLVLGGTIFLFLANFGGFTTTIDSDKLDHFGSFIGGLVGAIWSLASFILLYVSLQQQKEDIRLTNEALRLQIDEFKLQQKELEGTKIALEEQSKTQELQRFESTFFNLIEHYKTVFNSVRFKKTDYAGIYQKEQAFAYIVNYIDKLEIIRFKEHRDTKEFEKLFPYFTFVRSIFKFILNSTVENKMFYFDLFISILSEDEKKCIIMYCAYSDDFKNILEKVNRLNHSFSKFELYKRIFNV